MSGPLAAQQEPLSAIDWLSRSVEPNAQTFEPPVSNGATAPQITVTPLDRPSKDMFGLLPQSVTGLPRSLWSASDEDMLVALLQAERVEALPAIQDFLKVIILAEADPPRNASPSGTLFLARVDKLLDLGAIEPAQALIEQASPDTAPLFRRWFDVALLTGTENAVCDVMGQKPSIAPTYSARIFCLARNGDWATAALTLNTHRVLGDVTDAEEMLLTRFLDPEIFEGAPALAAPARISPLMFRMHEAIGEGLTTSNLPLAFAHADLRATVGWKPQLEAAERLARYGAVSENVLQGFYTAHTPAASGGVWDRARAVQQFDRAITAQDPADIAATLPAAWAAMRQSRTEVQFAKLYGPALLQMPLSDDAQELAITIGLLSPDYETFARGAAHTSYDPFLIALARGRPQEQVATSPKARAIQAAFNGSQPPPVLLTLVDQGKLGEALLRAIALFNEGFVGDYRLVTDALALMRHVGLEDVARRSALQLMLLERTT
ncbi:hypothetical protein SAMN04488005_1471 [Yoonia tamlensis]|uniref:Uncharacterized protein n=1 Tax=Yoonia tamlensis TaxID=390270 RepID=A0A1I6GDJ4_9RHOB|nr:hypothetical protein [Yoonia tamlensis]SFR40259.1 hypothetical protein SAMN04488005_1471 [Yoonia tamlensis]